MGDESAIAELLRCVSLIEQDVDGGSGVSRHILRKVTESKTALLDLRAAESGGHSAGGDPERSAHAMLLIIPKQQPPQMAE